MNYPEPGHRITLLAACKAMADEAAHDRGYGSKPVIKNNLFKNYPRRSI